MINEILCKTCVNAFRVKIDEFKGKGIIRFICLVYPSIFDKLVGGNRECRTKEFDMARTTEYYQVTECSHYEKKITV